MEVGLWGWYDSLYPLLPTAIHLKIVFMKIVKRRGESVSPCMVPPEMEGGAVLPWMVMQYVLEAEYSCLHAAV